MHLEPLTVDARPRQRREASDRQPTTESNRALVCPNCRGPLTLRYAASVEVDECPSCKTAWFDEGELDAVLRDRTGAGIGTLGPSDAPEHVAVRCPLCPRTTKTFRFHAAPNARVYACPGHGEWVEEDDGRIMVRWAKREYAKVVASFDGIYLRRSGRLLDIVGRLNLWTVFVFWWVLRDVFAAAGLAMVVAALTTVARRWWARRA